MKTKVASDPVETVSLNPGIDTLNAPENMTPDSATVPNIPTNPVAGSSQLVTSSSEVPSLSNPTVLQPIYSYPESQKPNHSGTVNTVNTQKSLAVELLNLSKYGWYWGPITQAEAVEKLLEQPDGSFLVSCEKVITKHGIKS